MSKPTKIRLTKEEYIAELEGIEKIIEQLNAGYPLTEIELVKQEIDDNQIKELCAALRKNQSVTLLNLSDNDLTIESFAIIQELLEHNHIITRINLEDNIKPSEFKVAIVPIEEALKRNIELTKDKTLEAEATPDNSEGIWAKERKNKEDLINLKENLTATAKTGDINQVEILLTRIALTSLIQDSISSLTSFANQKKVASEKGLDPKILSQMNSVRTKHHEQVIAKLEHVLKDVEKQNQYSGVIDVLQSNDISRISFPKAKLESDLTKFDGEIKRKNKEQRTELKWLKDGGILRKPALGLYHLVKRKTTTDARITTNLAELASMNEDIYYGSKRAKTVIYNSRSFFELAYEAAVSELENNPNNEESLQELKSHMEKYHLCSEATLQVALRLKEETTTQAKSILESSDIELGIYNTERGTNDDKSSEISATGNISGILIEEGKGDNIAPPKNPTHRGNKFLQEKLAEPDAKIQVSQSIG
jgi:hypothetical protein